MAVTRRMSASVLLLLTAGVAWGATYKVTTNAGSGLGSLRWAIGAANNHAGPDKIVFAPKLTGKWIRPKNALPAITDAYTRVLADTDGDGAPDITLSGEQAGPADGLVIRADNCVVKGLAITGFEGHGISLSWADNCTIQTCHVGVNRMGTKAVRNGLHQIRLRMSDGNTIGGWGANALNVIAAGAAGGMRSGIYVANSSDNHIRNNNIGVARDGQTPLTNPDDSGTGITLITAADIVPADADRDVPDTTSPARGNLIGGRLGDRNVIGGMKVGIDIFRAYENAVSANCLGVGRAGTKPTPISGQAVRIRGASQYNGIGAQSEIPERRNIISCGRQGVVISDPGTRDNGIIGNYFGLDAPGTDTLPMGTAITCLNGAGVQRILSNTFGGEYPTTYTPGIFLYHGGDGSLIHKNTFARPEDVGVDLTEVKAFIGDNDFIGNGIGIYCLDVPPTARVWDNSFSGCGTAVYLDGASGPNLGNLSNSTPVDDGNNRFYPSNTWYIRNYTKNHIRAEGNRFQAGLPSPHHKIWDYLDDPTLGAVDLYPLGPSLPTLSSAAALTISGATAVPAAIGAEIAFTLPAEADVSVSVLNIAGRSVATVCRARACEAGTSTLIWNALSDSGLPAPNGTYLVEITATTPEGAQARAVTHVQVKR